MSPSSRGLVVAWMGSPSATRWEAVTIQGCHLLQSLRSFGKWYPRLPSGQPPAEVARSAVDVTLQPSSGGAVDGVAVGDKMVGGDNPGVPLAAVASLLSQVVPPVTQRSASG